MIDRKMLRPSLAVALSAVIWGLWWIPLRALDARGISGDWASALLFGTAAMVMSPFLLSRVRSLRRGGASLLIIGLCTGVALSFWNHALIVGDVIRVALLFYLAPVWATALGMLVLKEPMKRARLLSILLGFMGAVVVLGFAGGIPLPQSEGEWMGLVAGVLFAIAATLTRKLGEAGGFEKSFLSFLCAAVTAFVLIATRPTGAMPEGSVIVAELPLLLGGMIWVIPSTWLILWGAERLDPGRTSILLLLELLTAAISAAMLSGEPVGWRELIGSLLILTAGVIEALGQEPVTRTEAPHPAPLRTSPMRRTAR